MSAITDFLNSDGLNTLWSKIKTYISNNTVAKETGKGLSTNDFTAADKAKLDSFGTKCRYVFNRSTRKLTLSYTPNHYKVYYRNSTGVLRQLHVASNAVTIPSDTASVIEVIVMDITTTSKSVIII